MCAHTLQLENIHMFTNIDALFDSFSLFRKCFKIQTSAHVHIYAHTHTHIHDCVHRSIEEM